MSRQRVVTKVWGFSTVPSVFLEGIHFSYTARKSCGGRGQGGKTLFLKTSFFLQYVMFFDSPSRAGEGTVIRKVI